MIKIFRTLFFLIIAAVVVYCFAYYDVWNHAVEQWNEYFPSGLHRQESVAYETDQDRAWNPVEEKANQKHEKPSLDEKFIQKNFGVDSMDELKEDVLVGQTEVTRDMKEGTGEYRLALDMMNKAKLHLMTQDDIQKTYDKCEKALDQLAKEKSLNRQSLLESYYDMDSKEYDAFVRKISDNLSKTNQTMQNQ